MAEGVFGIGTVKCVSGVTEFLHPVQALHPCAERFRASIAIMHKTAIYHRKLKLSRGLTLRPAFCYVALCCLRGLSPATVLSSHSHLLPFLPPMTQQFRRILDLVRKTGDTLVVTDPDGDDVFVVMGMEQYEWLIGEEAGEAKEAEETKEADEKDIWGAMKPAHEDGETWDLSKMDKNELSDLEEQYRQFAHSRVEEAVSEKTANQPKNGEKPKDDDELGEEQFYLEPVE